MVNQTENEEDLQKFYENLSFLKILEKSTIPEWQKGVIKEVWDLKNEKSGDLKWTDQNLSEIIKRVTSENAETIEALMKEEM